MKKNECNEKELEFAHTSGEKHWVGDGFHVHSMLQPNPELNKYISPFLLLDYAPPEEFSKTNQRRGVGKHPHRGFETVTFAYSGEVEHRDSSGGGGVIKPGDVQWMTAGGGVVHDEFHSDSFSKEGGLFEMVQLWVNLPKKDKMITPKYQAIENKDIPQVNLAPGTELRVVAGEFNGQSGPASTFTPINIYDLKSETEQDICLSFKENSNTIILIMRGELKLKGESYLEQNVLIFGRKGEEVNFNISKDFKGLILNGEPIDEPVIHYGPFVMNTKEEIAKAFDDFQNGKMGNL